MPMMLTADCMQADSLQVLEQPFEAVMTDHAEILPPLEGCCSPQDWVAV